MKVRHDCRHFGQRSSHYLKFKGFTFIELLVWLAILGVLSWMCLPIDCSFYQKNQLQVMENEISSAVRYARNMTLSYEVPLILAPLPNTMDWSKGMILFVDNKNHQYVTDSKLLHQWQWNPHGLHVTWKGFHSNNYLLFSPDLKNAATSGHFNLLTSLSQHSQLVVNRFGRVSAPEA